MHVLNKWNYVVVHALRLSLCAFVNVMKFPVNFDCNYVFLALHACHLVTDYKYFSTCVHLYSCNAMSRHTLKETHLLSLSPVWCFSAYFIIHWFYSFSSLAVFFLTTHNNDSLSVFISSLSLVHLLVLSVPLPLLLCIDSLKQKSAIHFLHLKRSESSEIANQ